MHNSYRLTCDLCRHEWFGYPYDTDHVEKCPECNSDIFEIGKEYRPFKFQSFWIVLFVLNVLLT